MDLIHLRLEDFERGYTFVDGDSLFFTRRREVPSPDMDGDELFF